MWLGGGIFVVLLVVIIISNVWSTAADTHIVGLLPMLTIQYISLVITTPETETVNFTVSSLKEVIAHGSVTPGTPMTIDESTLLAYNVSSELDRYKGILVTTGTEKKISVTVAMSHLGDYSTGVYVNYPISVYSVNACSYVYYAMSIGTDESTSFSTLLIVSSNNNTNITITPTVTVTIPPNLTQSGRQIVLNAGQSITIQLQYLETLLLKPVAALADLTGTKVESHKPLSVYSGHTCGFIPVGQFACDFVGEQIPPVVSWGNEFLVQSFYNRQSGYILKLIGSQNSTTVNILCDNGNSYSLSLQEGGVLSQTISQTSCYINSTSPILVAQFSLAQFADASFTSYGDPAMTIIPPLHQYATSGTSFPIITLLGAFVSVNLIVLAADESSKIQLNGTVLPSLTSSSWKHYNTSVGGSYVFNSYSLSAGSGEIRVWSNNSNDKILAMVYGLQQFVGYSYSGTLDMKPFEVCCLHCEAGYAIDTATCTCSLSNICLLSPCQNGVAPNISAPISYVATLSGSNVSLRCVLHEAGSSVATIQWSFNGSIITNSSLFLITEGSTKLNITNITTSLSGSYHCNAANIFGTSVVAISVNVQKPPYFITTPPNSVLVAYSKSITLKCSFGGVPLPNITWFKDGMVIPSDQYTSSSQSDTVTTILTVPVSFTSQRNYTCQAVNYLVERRVISTTVNVTIVNTPPVIEASDTFMITVGETALYTLHITDPGDTISVTIEFDGEFPYTLDQNGSIWTLNVTLSSLVEFNFTVIATDSFNATTAKTPQVIICGCPLERSNCTQKGISHVSNPLTLKCDCMEAYEGEYCEDDFDGCTEVSCFNNATCTDVPAPGTGVICPPCPSGYTGDGIICYIPQVILPYVVFNNSISKVTNISSTQKVNAPRPINLLGSVYSSVYISISGTFSMSGRFTYFYSRLFPSSIRGIRDSVVFAPMWNFYDIRREGSVSYQTFSSNNPLANDVFNDVNSFIKTSKNITSYKGIWMLVMEWREMHPYHFGYLYNGQNSVRDRQNTFQAILTTDGSDTHIIYTYKCGDIMWDNYYSRSVVGYNIAGGRYENHRGSGIPGELLKLGCYDDMNQPANYTNIVYSFQSDEKDPNVAICLERYRNDLELPEISSSFAIPCPCSAWQVRFDRSFRFTYYYYSDTQYAECYSNMFPQSYQSMCCYRYA
uniref:Ig-like domain-containing protein n=1 Tax=Amphimedon queenslandica TaxID=400682 RepID=A0A1X7VD55_AMPQE